MRTVTDTTAMGLVQAGPNTWRVRDRAGLVRGHVAAVPGPDGVRLRAMRFHPPSGRFRTLGEFWTLADAVECVRLSR